MPCDECKKDYCFWTELFWNGRYKHADTFFRILKRKMYVCAECLPKTTLTI